MHVLLALLVLSAAETAPKKFCQTDADGFCTEPVVRFALSYAETDPELFINAGLGDVLAIELPLNVLVLKQAVGNEACFKVEKREDSSGILIWPKMPDNAGEIEPASLLGEKTNLYIQFDSGITLLIRVRIARPEKSVQRLVITFPEREEETAHVRKEILSRTKKLEEEYQKRRERLHEEVAAEAQRSMARAVLEGVHCTGLRERGERGLLIVNADQICRIGNSVYIEFEIVNRARDLFRLHSVEVLVGDSDKQAAIPSEVELEGDASPLQLGFDGKRRGMVYFTAEGVSEAREYVLQVTESGGKKRVVTLDDIGF